MVEILILFIFMLALVSTYKRAENHTIRKTAKRTNEIIHIILEDEREIIKKASFLRGCEATLNLLKEKGVIDDNTILEILKNKS